jgi:transposase-like protein
MSGRACSICSRADFSQIVRALASGESMQDIASRFGVQKSSLHRCSKNHQGRQTRPYQTGKGAGRPQGIRSPKGSRVKTRSATGDELSPEALKQRALNLLETGERIMATAEDANDLRLCLAAHDRTQRALEMLCRVAGILGPDVVVNVDARTQNLYASWPTRHLEALQTFHAALESGASVADACEAVQGQGNAPALPPGRSDDEAA